MPVATREQAEKMSKPLPKWTAPDRPGGEAVVEQGGQVERFTVIVPKMEDHDNFAANVNRTLKMIGVLARGLKEFEMGRANYKNADKNLEHLLVGMEKAQERAQLAYRKFWDLYIDFGGQKATQKRVNTIEKMFSPHGEEFVKFVSACASSCALPEGDLGN